LTTSFIDVDVYITELNNNSSLDTVATGNLVNILQNVKLIGKIKLFNSTIVRVRNKGDFSPQAIGTIIGVVLAVYLVGYFLIISMTSLGARTDSGRPVSIIMASENIHYSTVDGKFVKRHSVDHMVSSKRLKEMTLATKHK